MKFDFTGLLKNEMKPALGVTEVGAIALAAARAYAAVGGKLQEIRMVMNGGMYKNAFSCAIPGTQELGCNKVALGHHLDDAVETFYMNLWREGRIGCFSPVTQLDRRGLTLIRPMLLATEHEVRCAVKEEDFPIVKSRCPADGVTVREQTKEFVRERCRTDHAFRQKTLHALQESGIDGWRPVHTGRGSFIQTAKKDES